MTVRRLSVVSLIVIFPNFKFMLGGGVVGLTVVVPFLVMIRVKLLVPQLLLLTLLILPRFSRFLKSVKFIRSFLLRPSVSLRFGVGIGLILRPSRRPWFQGVRWGLAGRIIMSQPRLLRVR